MNIIADVKIHLVTKSVCFVFFPSVEVNNFLKIDENQNEEVEDELPGSRVSRSWLLIRQHFLSKLKAVCL